MHAKKKLLISVLIFFALFGSLFFWTILEEVFHVLHGEGAQAVCIDLNAKIDDDVQSGYLAAHTSFKNINESGNVESFQDWREYSEYLVNHLMLVVLPLIGLIIGYCGGFLHGEHYR